MKFNKKEFKEIKFLGKGKSGYSYLVKDDLDSLFVLKKIHYEKCDYYIFDNKLEAEINDYKRLKDLVMMPKLIDIDYENEIILKEYIEGDSISDLIDKGININYYLNEIKEIANTCRDHGLNIDYYPTNFIVKNNCLYYVDYECNEYSEEWNFENWGKQYWVSD